MRPVAYSTAPGSAGGSGIGSDRKSGVGGRRPRGELRREAMVSAAAELFRKNGYRGTSIDDIGAAVGTSGPAIYRHFPNKEAILVEILERSVKRSQRDIEAVVEQGLSPRFTLQRIIEKSVDHVIEESDFVIMADQELGSLAPEARRRIGRERRVVVQAWVRAVGAIRPDLSPAEARAMSAAVLAVITSMARQTGVSTEVARALYVDMAMGVVADRRRS